MECFSALDENDEAAYAAMNVKRLMSQYPQLKAKDFAVLIRVNAISRAFEQEFNNTAYPTAFTAVSSFLKERKSRTV